MIVNVVAPMYPSLIIGIALLSVLCVFLVARTIGYRRRLTEYERAGAQLFSNVAVYILLIDPEFNVLRTNYYYLTGTRRRAATLKVGNLLRCKNGEIAGECGNHELCRACPVRAAIIQTFRTGTNFSGLEIPMTLLASDDSQKSVECVVSVSGNYMTGGGGNPRIVLTVNDITALKRVQQELILARRRAEESDRMKSVFLTNMTHELRTPLTAILGFSELLAGETTPEEKQEYIGIVRSNVETMLQQVGDMMDLSKIDTGSLEYEYTDIELNTIMEEQEGVFQRKIAPASPVKIVFRKQYPSCYLRSDRKRLSQVIANFLSNAVKYTFEGTIELGYEVRDDEVYIHVTDTGTGIPEHRIGQLFQRFGKAGSFKQGVGIGLAISKAIVEQMGGRIGVRSEVGKGSTFWFTLPRGHEA